MLSSPVPSRSWDTPSPTPRRYLFLFATPGAEAWVRANNWALLREMLAGAGGAPPQAWDMYLQRLSQPGEGRRGERGGGNARACACDRFVGVW